MAYQHIMVAFDGSDTSLLALHEAIALSKQLKAHLVVTYVFDKHPIAHLALDMNKAKYKEICNEHSMAILEKANQIAKKNECAVETKLIKIDDHKKISEKLVQTVKLNKIDLIILGTHGRRGFHRLLLGSVAEETLRLSPVPILLVRAKEGMAEYFLDRKYLPYKRIIIATDGSDTSNLALIQAIYLAKTMQATLYILHIANEFPSSKDFIFAHQFIQYQDSIKHQGQEILEKSKQICQENNIVPETMLVEIKDKTEWIADKILEVLHSLKPDLLVIGTRGQSGLNRFLLGSVAEETVRRAPVPVLLVRPEGHS